MSAKYHEIIDRDINNILDEVETVIAGSYKDVFIIIMDGDDPVLMGETGLLPTQIDALVKIVTDRWFNE